MISKSTVWKDSFVRPVGRNCLVGRTKEGNASPCSTVSNAYPTQQMMLFSQLMDAASVMSVLCLWHAKFSCFCCFELKSVAFVRSLREVWGCWSQSRWFCSFRVFQFRGWHFGWCLLLFTGAAVLTCAWLLCWTVQSTFLFISKVMDEFDLSTQFVV